MEESLLEVRDYAGKGYQPLVDFGAWRVAILRHLDELDADHIRSMERHTNTDEVFVLINGTGILLIGGNHREIDNIYPQVMEIGKIYNVKRNAWHTVILSRDAKIFLVENRDTDQDNTESAVLSPQQMREIRDFFINSMNNSSS